ncbi:MAG: TrkH family potassium uptake protein [Gammaproteobacteria bacterium]|nr:TrkH family potassium uptake protein [Gammaproteobacteria bacterium]
MQLLIVQRVLGVLLMLFSVTQLFPIPISLYDSDGQVAPFLLAFIFTLLVGLVLWFPVRNLKQGLRLRDGFVIVVMFWVVLGLFGAIPLMLSTAPHLPVVDAVFESVSGLTTTGATVITGLDYLPRSILFYRQQLQWLGGMGIIVLAVAILPMLGIGGMQLYRAETPGPMKDNKLTPRITETAKALWYIYLGLTTICALAYWLAGMELFDAVAHSFSTIAIGGFSPYDESMGYFDSPMIKIVAILFMILSGINFALHFVAWRNLSVGPYLLDSETRTYLLVLLFISVVTVTLLYVMHVTDTLGESMLTGIFQAVSISTTTGFTTEAYYLWPGAIPVILIFASFIGGCAGSTAGGIKVIRFMLLIKQGRREIMRLIHPNALIPIKVGGKPLSDRVINAVWGFFSAYVGSFVVIMVVLMISGLDQVTAFSAVAATMNNLGPGMGEVGANYADINDFAKWILCFAMLLGRLEVFTLLVILSGAFWRK